MVKANHLRVPGFLFQDKYDGSPRGLHIQQHSNVIIYTEQNHDSFPSCRKISWCILLMFLPIKINRTMTKRREKSVVLSHLGCITYRSRKPTASNKEIPPMRIYAIPKKWFLPPTQAVVERTMLFLAPNSYVL